jgi:3'-phosphoadenosine 5'-phosphosulfate sulfotransferase (PAPS reductase)/FAD synthetase
MGLVMGVDMNQILCSFSGGETSAYMAIKLKEKYPDTVFTFANTGEENEETLIFVNQVDKTYGLGVVWLESVVAPEKGVGSSYKVVDFETAARKGEPFEQVIRKYGLPNPAFLHCTRELKKNPIEKWAKDNVPDSNLAIGIRIDEIDRVNPDYKKNRLCYPLAFWWPTTKPEINQFWRDQSFRLNLKHYQGNCKWCYKKSYKKLAWIAKENPEFFDFPARMEKEYSFVTSKKDLPEPNTIFRQKKTVSDIREMALTAIEPFDDAKNYEVNADLFGFDMDYESDMCGSESCEAF